MVVASGGPSARQGVGVTGSYTTPVDSNPATRGRCHRFVYISDDGRPTHCPEPVVRLRWRRDGDGRWHVVDAYERHGSELLERPSWLKGANQRTG